MRREVERVLVPIQVVEHHALCIRPPLKTTRGDHGHEGAIVRRLGVDHQGRQGQAAGDAGQGITAVVIGHGPLESREAASLLFPDDGLQDDRDAADRLPVRAGDGPPDRDPGPGQEVRLPAERTGARVEFHDPRHEGRHRPIAEDRAAVVRARVSGLGRPDLERALERRDAEAAFPVGLARQGDREPAEPTAISTFERDHLIRQRPSPGDECLRGQSRRAALPDERLDPGVAQPPDELDARLEPDVPQVAPAGRDLDSPRGPPVGIDDQLACKAVGDVQAEATLRIAGPVPAQAAHRLLLVGGADLRPRHGGPVGPDEPPGDGDASLQSHLGEPSLLRGRPAQVREQDVDGLDEIRGVHVDRQMVESAPSNPRTSAIR